MFKFVFIYGSFSFLVCTDERKRRSVAQQLSLPCRTNTALMAVSDYTKSPSSVLLYT